APILATKYYVTAEDNSGGPNNGCTVSDSIELQVVPVPSATITTSGATTFCEGGSVGLIAGSGIGYQYQWYKDGNAVSGGGTSSTYSANESGVYSVEVIDPNGCSAMSTTISVTVHPMPTPSIISDG